MRSISKSVACLCLLLTLWSAGAFVAHHHSSAIETAKCPVCVAAHSASPKPASDLAQGTFVRLPAVRTQQVAAKQRLVTFALSVRPPPTV